MIIHNLIVILTIIYGIFLFCALSQKKYKIALPGYFLIGGGFLFFKLSPQLAIKTHEKNIDQLVITELTELMDRIYNLCIMSFWVIGIGLALSFFANLYITFRFRNAIFPFLWRRNNQQIQPDQDQLRRLRVREKMTIGNIYEEQSIFY